MLGGMPDNANLPPAGDVRPELSDEDRAYQEFIENSVAASRRAFMSNAHMGAMDPKVTFWRGLEATSGETETYVNTWLATIDGQNVVQALDARVTEAADEAALTGGEPAEVVYVDVGPGNCRALLDVYERFKGKGKIRPFGYGTDVHTKLPYRTKDGVQHPPTEAALQEADIPVVEGNVWDIEEVLGEDFADVITFHNGAHETRLPYWEQLTRIYGALKPGGVAYVSKVSIKNRAELAAYLAERGYEFKFNYDSVAFRKTHPKLDLPIRTVPHQFAVDVETVKIG